MLIIHQYMYVISNFRFAVASHATRIIILQLNERQASARYVEESCVLRHAAKRSGENVPETKIHQQARQKETSEQTRIERFTGRIISISFAKSLKKEWNRVSIAFAHS